MGASASRSTARRGINERAGTGGKDAHGRATLRRPAATLSLRADPHGALSDMFAGPSTSHPHLCGMASALSRCDSVVLRARPRAVSQRRGPCAFCRPLPPGGELGAQERAARTRGGLQSGSRPAPCVALRELPRAATRRSPCGRTTGRACFLRPICCDFTPFASSALTVAARPAPIAAAGALRHGPHKAPA